MEHLMKFLALTLASLCLVSCKVDEDQIDLIIEKLDEIEQPETPEVPTEQPVTPPEAGVTLSSLYECNGGGGSLMYEAIVENYSNAESRVYLTITGPDGTIEDVEMRQPASQGINYIPWPSNEAAGTPLSGKLQHGMTEQYRQSLGLSKDAVLFAQLRRSSSPGGFYLFVGQIGDTDRHEHIGLDPYGCWSVLQ